MAKRIGNTGPGASPQKPSTSGRGSSSASNAARRQSGASNAGANRRRQLRDIGAITNRAAESSKSPSAITRVAGQAQRAGALAGIIALGDRVNRAGVSRQEQEKIRNTSQNLREMVGNMNAAAAAREPKKPNSALGSKEPKPGSKGGVKNTDRSAAARKGWEKRRARGA